MISDRQMWDGFERANIEMMAKLRMDLKRYVLPAYVASDKLDEFIKATAESPAEWPR